MKVNNYNASVTMAVKNPAYAIYASPLNIITFGYDLYCYETGSCYSNGLGWSYSLPSFLTLYGSASNFFAGSSYFHATDIEVYVRSVNGEILYIIFLVAF